VLAILTRQTNIIWVGFIVAVSIIRELKEVDIVQLDEDGVPTGQRAWMIFDPLAADARFPRKCSPTILFILFTLTNGIQMTISWLRDKLFLQS
jgi:hypothetical protein